MLVSSGGAPLYEPNHWQDGSVQTVAVPPRGGIAVTNSLHHGDLAAGGLTRCKILAPVVPIV